jgi:hypothetical protein
MFTPISSLLTQAARRASIKTQVDVSLALERASGAIAAYMGDYVFSVRPAYIRYKTLFIAVPDASCAAQVGLYVREILAAVNIGSSKAIVDRIQVIMEADTAGYGY